MVVPASPQRQATIVVAGVDTHKDSHHVAVLDLTGRVLGSQGFPTTTAGYGMLLDFVAGFGVIDRIGVELTGSYGAALTRHLIGAGVSVVEVNTTDKATRARRGKDDAIDAVAAGQKVLSGMAIGVPKDTTGTSEAIRILTVVRDQAVKQRTQTWNLLKALIVTAPDELRQQLRRLTPARLLRATLDLTPDPGRMHDPGEASRQGLRRAAERITAIDSEIRDADRELAALVAQAAPTLLNRPGIGVHTAARFLITAANNIDRIPSDAAFARICGAAPIPVSSGKTHRMRLHRGGDRLANRALHMIIVGRLKNDPATQAYIAKKLANGHSKRDAIRALKRYVAREVYYALKADLHIT